MPLVLAIIGGDPARFAPYVDLFHRALVQLEKPDLPIAVHSPGFIADTDELAAEQYWSHHRVMRDRIGAERGWPPSTPAEYANEIAHGSIYLGSPETVARKLVKTISTLGIQRFDLKYSAGTLPHELMMRSIELYGSTVIPMVKDMLA
jgi:alkanesulfonate monooxygenase SsuD/methylene tetrahydromethanopterin reductase-like flavin-dependent oxidoreductase (luciferase family)